MVMFFMDEVSSLLANLQELASCIVKLFSDYSNTFTCGCN